MVPESVATLAQVDVTTLEQIIITGALRASSSISPTTLFHHLGFLIAAAFVAMLTSAKP
jgi:hypothetical protein